MSAFVAAIGRILIALLFIVSGAGKLLAPNDAAAMFANAGFSQSLVVPVGLFEVIAGICLAIGVMSGVAATALAIFTALTILFVHNQFADPTQMPVILGHVGLIGGLILVIANKIAAWQFDRMRLSRERDRTQLEANAARHDAELRAARAEARAEVASAQSKAAAASATHAVADSARTVPVDPVLVPAGSVPADEPVLAEGRPRRWYQVW